MDEEIQIIDNSFVTPKRHVFKLYKLRRKSTGLYSTGGSYAYWNKNGKTWTSLAGLSGHLSKHQKGRYNQHYYYNYDVGWDDLEIVTLEVYENEMEVQEASDYIKGINERREKRLAKENLAKEKRKIEQAKKELELAKKKVEDIQRTYGF